MEKVENKITAEQLEKLRGYVTAINQGQVQLGSIEVQKHGLLHQIAQVQSELKGFQKDLEDEYGKISINIQDGSYEEVAEDEVDTQN
jgi:ribosomal protein S15P/S13E